MPKTLKGRPYLFFHKNVLDDFNILLTELGVCSGILAFSESGIKKDSSSPINLQLNNYSTGDTPTELSAGGALLCICKRLSYQLKTKDSMTQEILNQHL